MNSQRYTDGARAYPCQLLVLFGALVGIRGARVVGDSVIVPRKHALTAAQIVKAYLASPQVDTRHENS